MQKPEKMDRALKTIHERVRPLAVLPEGEQAPSEALATTAFAEYRSRKAKSTVRRQDAALNVFSSYLSEVLGTAPAGEDLAENPEAWRGITRDLVDGFVHWLLLEGYSIGTINVRLSTVKTYAKLAGKHGAISAKELAMIGEIRGYRQDEGQRIDQRRKAIGIPTRVGDKKAKPIVLSRPQVDALKRRPDTPQGRRDAVLVGLMLDLGLRVGEVASLAVSNVNLESGELTFHRPSVDKTQRHRLPDELHEVLTRYVNEYAPRTGPLLRASYKDGRLTHAGMSERAITKRVRSLGEKVGVDDLSAQDLRHTWATWAARSGTPFDRLLDAGGWSSPEVPLRYVETAEIANEGVRLKPVTPKPDQGVTEERKRGSADEALPSYADAFGPLPSEEQKMS